MYFTRVAIELICRAPWVWELSYVENGTEVRFVLLIAKAKG
jgi:hypothetical protein